MVKIRFFLIITTVLASCLGSISGLRPLTSSAQAQDTPLEEIYNLCSKFPLNSQCEGFDVPVPLDERPGLSTHCWLDGGDQSPANECKFEFGNDSSHQRMTVYIEQGEPIELLGDRRGTKVLELSTDDIGTWHATNTLSGAQNALALLVLHPDKASTDNRSSVLRLRMEEAIAEILLLHLQSISRTDRLEAIAPHVAISSSSDTDSDTDMAVPGLEAAPLADVPTESGHTGTIDTTVTEQNKQQLLDTNRCIRCDLRGVNLAGANLEKANLEGADLRGADLTEATLEKAYLVGADLSGATLTDADLDRTTLTGARLTDSILTNATLRSALIQAAHFQGSTLQGVDMSGFTVGTLAIFDRAMLQNANVSGAYLEGASFETANLMDATFGTITIQASKENGFLPRSKGGAYITRTMLQEANFNHADLTQVNFNGADLIRATFQHAVLVGALFNSATVKAAFVPPSPLPNTTFDNSSSRCENFNRSSLEDVSIVQMVKQQQQPGPRPQRPRRQRQPLPIPPLMTEEGREQLEEQFENLQQWQCQQDQQQPWHQERQQTWRQEQQSPVAQQPFPQSPINLLNTEFQDAYWVAPSVLDSLRRYIVSTTLEEADFRDADLTNAELKRAVIRNANFEGAILEGTDLPERQPWPLVDEAVLPEPSNVPIGTMEDLE